MNSTTAAIDFGSGKIALAIGEMTESGVRIVSYLETPSAGIKNGDIGNNYQVEQAVSRLISETESATGIHIDEVVAGIGARILHRSDHTARQNRPHPEERIDEYEIDLITQNRYNMDVPDGETILEAVPQSYNVDDSVGLSRTDTIGREGNILESSFRIVSGKEDILSKRRSILENCGLKMKQAILSPIASARAVLTGPELENGTALIDIGCGTSEIAIIKDNKVIDIATIPFGGESVTDDIKSEALITNEWAERVKVDYGCCCEEFVPENKKLVLENAEGSVEGEVDLTLLSRIIEARIAEILDAARYVIDNCSESSHLGGGVVLTGGTAYCENILQLAKAILGRKVRLAAPCASICSDSSEGAFDTYASTAVGLVIESLDPMLSHAPVNSGRVDRINKVNSPVIRTTLFDSGEIEFDTPVSTREKKAQEEKERKLREQAEKEQRKKEKERLKEEKQKQKSQSLGNLFSSFFSDNDNNV